MLCGKPHTLGTAITKKHIFCFQYFIFDRTKSVKRLRHDIMNTIKQKQTKKQTKKVSICSRHIKICLKNVVCMYYHSSFRYSAIAKRILFTIYLNYVLTQCWYVSSDCPLSGENNLQSEPCGFGARAKQRRVGVDGEGGGVTLGDSRNGRVSGQATCFPQPTASVLLKFRLTSFSMK